MFKVGTLDSLMALSEELSKVDNYIEGLIKKIASQLHDVLDVKNDKLENLTVNNNNMETYLQFFRWDESKYSTSLSLKALNAVIHDQILKLDEDLRGKVSEYNTLVNNLNQESRKTGGKLVTKDLTDIVEKKHWVETEYLDTVIVTVPKSNNETFLATYEKLHQYVVPRSAQLITSDGEHCLYSITVFRKFIDEFKSKCRENKINVRDFVFDPNKVGKNDRQKMEGEKEKQRKVLIRWCKANFSEAFIGWIHLKAIRIFVESVLRYGLPTNFQLMLLAPHKGKEAKLRKVLQTLYGHLSSKNVFVDDNADEDVGQTGPKEKFFPYVWVGIELPSLMKSN